MVKIAITGLVCAVVGLATPGYPDSHDPPTAEDIAYMKRTLEDAAEGCRVFLNPAVPGDYMTSGVIEEWGDFNGVRYWPATHHCIDATVFHVGSCVGIPWIWDWEEQGRVTLSVYPDRNGEYHLRDNDSELLIHSQSTADDFAISLRPSILSHNFVYAGHDDADVWMEVLVMQNGFGHFYTAIYNPATETLETFDNPSPYVLASAPEVADVLREPLRKFFARLRSIIETGIVPAAEPLVPCPEWEFD